MGDKGNNSGFDPEIVLMYCRHCTASGVDMDSAPADAVGFRLRTAMLPCSSKVEAQYLLKIIEKGADAVQLVACPDGHCRFLVGNKRAEKRINYTRRLLDEIQMGAERIGMVRGEKKLTREKLIESAADRAEAVRELGPNPMRSEKK